MTVSFGVRQFDYFEVLYREHASDVKREVFPSVPKIPREFVELKATAGATIISIKYYVDIMVERSGQNTVAPHQRFGEVTFTTNEFQNVSNAWVENARCNVIPEIDGYISDRFGVLPSE